MWSPFGFVAMNSNGAPKTPAGHYDTSIPMVERPPRPATVERMLRRTASVDMGDEEADVGLDRSLAAQREPRMSADFASAHTRFRPPQRHVGRKVVNRNRWRLLGGIMSPLANGHATSALMLGGVKDTSTDSSSMACRGADFQHLEPYGQHSLSEDEIVSINVSGMHFQTMESTLRRFPSSILGNPQKRKRYWNAKTNEYFFDRHRPSFEAILHIYQTNGQVLRPESVPINLFLRELKFYEFDSEVLTNFWQSEGYEKPQEVELPEGKVQRFVWELMEHPDSSFAARILAFISIGVIILSIVSFCLETLPQFKTDDDGDREWSSPFFFIEFVCCVWFSAEFLMRFASSPSKTKFLKSFLNLLDVVAVAPFFINLIWASMSADTSHDKNSSISFSVLRIIRLVRVFRIFKLSRHSVGLQVLGKTFRASVQEFLLLIFFMVIALVLFSSGIFFAEQNEPDTKFTSIPASFWFVLATITTVGFGDLVPTTTYGKIVGSCCALIGVLTLALPVPIIVANFKHFYRQECRLALLYVQNQEEEAIKEEHANGHSNGHTTNGLPNGHTIATVESGLPAAEPAKPNGVLHRRPVESSAQRHVHDETND
ncbi:Potassium voltage-gated channel protein Shaker [Aphelenchoides fujianensis]|nr:Potassium voltage-gated channel protein Shaker [Aphelenchoides fujianensis]